MTVHIPDLPSRPLRLNRSAVSIPLASYFATPVLIVIIVFMVLSEGPGLLRDYEISRNPVVVEDATIVDGKCTTRKAVFTTCKAALVYDRDGKRHESDVEIMFVDLHSGDYETEVVVSGDNPALATLSLGLDKLANRAISFAILLFLLVFGIIALVLQTLRAAATRRRIATPARLTPIPVLLTSVQRKNGRLAVAYADRLAVDKTGRVANTRFARGEEPLIIGEEGNTPVALAVRHPAAPLPVLLDSDLERIDLTDQERSALIGAEEIGDTAEQPVQLSQTKQYRKPGQTIGQRIGVFFGVLLMIFVGVIGYWLWYVLASPSQFNSPGMDLNHMMPAPINRWGCERLQSRFGSERAPFGCTAPDHMNWK
ncbi:tetrahydromethanopterin S-methyltransferase subunit G [Neorhizobium galegae]|uniref:hypothetical protein n=1 Tax=Neorhizobium galegae TaxID=399 RepID=UPI001AEA9BB4|nr:hypothetical protein [Neorhizobium galegae]MBP2547573.1 tetrahydromethanopterin S-methyltransferase subunit G [Neorhizobium galegae]